MGRRRRAAAILPAALGLWLIWTGHSVACTPVNDYFQPTNFELVQLADVIVVAKPAREIAARDWGGGVEFRVEKVLKGPAVVTVSASTASLGETTPSDPGQIERAHRDDSACVRSAFDPKAAYVLFAKRDKDGAYWVMRSPYTRVAEDFAGDQSLWVKTVEAYRAIQAGHDPLAQIKALEALREQTLAQAPSSDRDALVEDIEAHLGTPSPYKPTAYLVWTYEILEREGAVADGFEPRPVVLGALAQGDHPAATPLFDRLVGSGKLGPYEVGSAIEFYARNKQHPRAYEIIETLALQQLVVATPDQRRDLLEAIDKAQRGPSYEDGDARWRKDAEIAAAWPELAFRLDQFNKTVEPTRHTLFPDALRQIKVSDYRERPALTRALARDEPIERWAIGQLENKAMRQAWEAAPKIEERPFELENPAKLPMEVLVLGGAENRQAVLRATACQSRDRRLLLIKVLAEWGDSLDTSIVEMIAGIRGLSADEKRELAKAAAKIHGRGAHDPGFTESPAVEWLKAFLAGKNKIAPTRC